MLRTLLIALTLLLNFSYALSSTNCTGVEAQNKIQDYLSCQPQWTKGLCGVAFGHLSASFITATVQGTLKQVISENEDALAQHYWERLRRQAIESMMSQEDLNLDIDLHRAALYRAEGAYQRIKVLPYHNVHTVLEPSDLDIIKQENPDLFKRMQKYLSDIVPLEKQMTELELQLLGDSDKYAADYKKLAKKAHALADRNKTMIEKSISLITDKYSRIASGARANIKSLLGTRAFPEVTYNGRRINPEILYEDLHPNIQRQLKKDISATLLDQLNDGPAETRRALRTLNTALGKNLKGLAARLVRMPKLIPMLASKGFAKAFLYASGALTFLELLTFSSNAGCGSDTLHKEYINYDYDSCTILNELSQNNLNFLSLPQSERESYSKYDKIKNHYENICNSYFNTFSLQDFTCEKDKIIVMAKSEHGTQRQEFHYKDKKLTELVLSPGQNIETRVAIDDAGIKSIESPIFRKSQVELLTYSRKIVTLQGQSDANAIQKQNDFWLPRFILYSDSIASCCQEATKDQYRCRKTVLGIFSGGSTEIPAQTGVH